MSLALHRATRCANLPTLLLSFLITIGYATPTPANGLTTGTSHLAISPSHPSLTIPPTNLSATLPPDSFSIEPIIGGVSLDRGGCFLVTIAALSHLVQADYESSDALQIIRGYPRLEIGLDGPSAENPEFQVKYMIWGITLAYKHMVDNNQWLESRFTLRSRNVVVGSLWYASNPHPWLQATNETSAASTSTPAVYSLAQLVDDDENPAITFDISELVPEARGQILAMKYVMMAIVAGFTDIARHDMDRQYPTRRFTTVFPSYGAEFDLLVNYQPTRRPWFTYDVLRRVLVQLAGCYLSQWPWKSAVVAMKLDGVRVGSGLLTAVQPRIGGDGDVAIA